jgi:hypothetical protein
MLAVVVAGITVTGCYAETLPATNVTATSAVLHGRGHTDSAPATVYFEYAPSSQGLGSGSSFRTPRRSVPANTPGPGKPDLEFHVAVKALKPATSYDFRVCGRDETNPNRTTYDCAATRSFTTPSGSPEVSFLRRPAFPIQSGGFANFEAADFNRDGKLDLAQSLPDGIGVRLGDGSGGFGEVARIPSFTFERVFAVGDLNDDGKPDLITEIRAPSTIIVRLGDGAGGFSSPSSSVGVEFEPASPVLRDFDRDGDLDMALLAVDSGHGLFGNRIFPKLLANDGAGHLSLGPAPNLGPDLPFPLAAADLNSDGKQDLVATVVQGPADNNARLASVLGNGNLTFAAPLTSPIGALAGSLVLGDYNRDGRTDAALDGAALTGDGNGRFGNVQDFPARAQPSHRADFNRDGIPDLVGRSSGPVRVLLGEGDATFRTPNDFPGVTQLVEDFNRDGKPDVLVLDGEAGEQASVLLNTTP